MTCPVCGDKGCVWCWKALADAPSFNETREWTFPNGHKLKFGPDDGEPYQGSQCAKIGWIPELMAPEPEPDYEALGYEETSWGTHHDIDAIAVIAANPTHRWLMSFMDGVYR